MTRCRTFVLATGGLCTALWAYACTDGVTDPPPAEPARATTLTVEPATARLTALGGTVQLSAQVRDQDGQARAGASVTWSTEDASVATVDGSGLVTAAGNGTVEIRAASGPASDTATVTVEQAASTVAVSPAADTLFSGDTLRLTALASDANGHAIAGARFSWKSSDTAVAAVDASGLVTGVAEGTATITATAD